MDVWSFVNINVYRATDIGRRWVFNKIGVNIFATIEDIRSERMLAKATAETRKGCKRHARYYQ